MKSFFMFFLIGELLVPSPTLASKPAKGLSPGEIEQRAKQAAVVVYCGQYYGTGVIIPNGKVLTAFHVIKQHQQYQQPILVCYQGSHYPAQVYAGNRTTDICILSVHLPNAQTVPLVLHYEPSLKEPLYLMGYPEGCNGVAQFVKATFSGSDQKETLKDGSIVEISYYAGLARPGMSGSPVYNRYGEVIGDAIVYEADHKHGGFVLTSHFINWLSLPSPPN